MLEDGSDVDQIIESRGLKQVTDSGAIESLVERSSPTTLNRCNNSEMARKRCWASWWARP